MANEGSTKPTYSELDRLDAELHAYIDGRIADDPDALLTARDAWKLRDVIAELARVRGLLQRQWISVEERLPEDEDNSVWVCFENSSHYCSARYIDEEWFGYDLQIEDTFHIEQKITHWMPLHKLTTFPQSSSLVPEGAESADIGKLDAADKAAKVVCSFCGSLDWTMEKFGRITHKQACPHRTDKFSQSGSAESGVEMGKVNRVPEKCRNCGWQVCLVLGRWRHTDELMPNGTCDKPEPPDYEKQMENIYNALTDSVLELSEEQIIQETRDAGLDPTVEAERVRQIIKRARGSAETGGEKAGPEVDTVYVIESGEYEQRGVDGVAASVEDAVSFLRARYSDPYEVEWSEVQKQTRGADYFITGKFAAVLGYSTAHACTFDITLYEVATFPSQLSEPDSIRRSRGSARRHNC